MFMNFVKILTNFVLLLLLSKFYLYIFFIIKKEEGRAPPRACVCARPHGSSPSRPRDETCLCQGGTHPRQGGA